MTRGNGEPAASGFGFWSKPPENNPFAGMGRLDLYLVGGFFKLLTMVNYHESKVPPFGRIFFDFFPSIEQANPRTGREVALHGRAWV